jgi:hypothetical protein
MSAPNLTNLVNCWEMLGLTPKCLVKKPSHWIGLWQKKDSANAWLPYTESLVQAVLIILRRHIFEKMNQFERKNESFSENPKIRSELSQSSRERTGF